MNGYLTVSDFRVLYSIFILPFSELCQNYFLKGFGKVFRKLSLHYVVWKKHNMNRNKNKCSVVLQILYPLQEERSSAVQWSRK